MHSPEKQAATSALFAAALHCPSRAHTDAFNDYQATVMEPLRHDLRNASQQIVLEVLTLRACPTNVLSV